MTDRDRLIELLAKNYNCVNRNKCLNEQADCLIANGVILPPCKVGQTVYYIAGKKVYKSKCHAITKHKNSLQIHLYDYDGDNARCSTKDVFLTKEEAEQKLKELKSNG